MKRYVLGIHAIPAVLASKSTVLLVLGLPQCGTDAVSAVLERCGAKGQSAGHLAQAQEKLLLELGSGWDSPLELPERCFKSSQALQFENNLSEALLQNTPDTCSMACLHGMERILPLWQQALERNDFPYRHVLVVRHPLDVAEQFRASHGWNRDHALLIWLQSNLAMEQHSAAHQRVVLDSEQVHWDLDETLNMIEGRLQLSLPERNHKALLELESMRASKTPSAAPVIEATTSGSWLLTMALQLHDWLLAESQHRERATHLPKTIRQQLHLAESLMGRTLNDLSLRNDALKGKLRSLEQRRSVRFINWLHRSGSAAA